MPRNAKRLFTTKAQRTQSICLNPFSRLCALSTTIGRNLSFLRGFSRGQLCQFVDVSLARRQQGGDSDTTFFGQDIAMGTANFFDQPMCPQQSKFPGDGRSLALLLFGSGFAFEQKASDIPVAKATELKLAPIDRLEKCGVGRRPGIECPHRPSL